MYRTFHSENIELSIRCTLSYLSEEHLPHPEHFELEVNKLKNVFAEEDANASTTIEVHYHIQHQYNEIKKEPVER